MTRSLVRVIVGPFNEPPFTVDAIAVEDDTFNVVGAHPEFQPIPATIGESVAALDRAEPHPLGTVVVKAGRPLIFQAIVHDLSREPSCTEPPVRAALAAIFAEAERRSLKAVALAPIGTRYRSIGEARFLELFNAALAGAAFRSIEQIWLVVPDGFGAV